MLFYARENGCLSHKFITHPSDQKNQTAIAAADDEPHPYTLFSQPAALVKRLTIISNIMLHLILLLGFSFMNSLLPFQSFTTILFSPKHSTFLTNSHRSKFSLILHQQSNSDLLISQSTNQTQWLEKRPHEQRRTQPRKARRLNHSFQHLYRHDSPLFDDAYIASGSYVMTHSREYLSTYGGYSSDIVNEMCIQFPPLQDLHVHRHLRPKMRFLKYTLLTSFQNSTLASSLLTPSVELQKKETKKVIPWVPPQYFGSRLERTIAPRHAFLIHQTLPHGRLLFELENFQGQILLIDFLQACRQDKTFLHLCKEWRRKFGFVVDPSYPKIQPPYQDHALTSNVNDSTGMDIKDLEYFDTTFQRGILSAARNEMVPEHHRPTPSLLTSEQMIYLLIRHGANPLEKDVRDISLFHWAAGSGNLQGLKMLIDMTLPGGLEEALFIKADRDGATLLHWAATGAQAKNFGCGGHYDVCRYLLDYFTVHDPSLNSVKDDRRGPKLNEKEVVNACTRDGNSVLMWAAWSGSLDVVKLLVRHRADVLVQNRNGCTVAHWAASGGNLELCKYLYDILEVDFSVANFSGNTPLSHAMAYGRKDVVQWLLDDVGVQDTGDKARLLAIDMMQWGVNDDKKRNLHVTMALFGDYEYSSEDDYE